MHAIIKNRFHYQSTPQKRNTNQAATAAFLAWAPGHPAAPHPLQSSAQHSAIHKMPLHSMPFNKHFGLKLKHKNSKLFHFQKFFCFKFTYSNFYYKPHSVIASIIFFNQCLLWWCRIFFLIVWYWRQRQKNYQYFINIYQ